MPAFLKKAVKHVLLVFLVSFFCFLLLLSLYLASFFIPVGFAGFFLLLFGGWLAWKRTSLKILCLTISGWAFVNGLMVVNSVSVYNRERTSYMNTVASGGHLSFREKMNVYVLNVFMSAAAWPFYPEAALETFLLMFPAERNQRRFPGGFFLDSKLVKKKLSNLKEGDTAKIRWSGDDYVLGRREARYAPALNPCKITYTMVDGARVYEARVPVRYPDRCEVAVIGGPLPIRVGEGLFGYLQRCGWPHPYEAVWWCRITAAE